MNRRLAMGLLLVCACAKQAQTEDEPPVVEEAPARSGGRGGNGGRAAGSGGGGILAGAGGSSTAGGGGAMMMTSGGAGGGGGATGGTAGSAVDAAAPSDAASSGDRPRNDAPGAPEVGGMAAPCKYAFCESFEQYAEGGSPTATRVWTREHASIVVGSQRVLRGMRALHVPDIVSGQRFIRTTRPYPMLAGEHYGRMFLWIEQEPQAKPAGVYHWTAVETSDRAAGFGFVVRHLGGLSYGPTNNQLFFNIETHGNGEIGNGDDRARLAPKVWHCLEWYYNRTNSQAKTWWNGQERPSLAWPDPSKQTDPKYTDPKWTFPEPKAFSVGWAVYQQGDIGWDIWIDEVALHTARVGCDG